MTGRGRLPLLILLVVGFVAVVALVAHGRPLAASAGRSGVPDSFWSYILTTAVILVTLGGLLLVATLLDVRMNFTKPQTNFVAVFIRNFIGVFVIGLLLTYLVRHSHHGLFGTGSPEGGGKPIGPPTGGKQTPAASRIHFVWLEAVVVFAVLVAAIAAAVALRPRRRGDSSDGRVAPEVVAEALDESLDDLRTDPDLRRAIVAAYARMEKALGATGLPRQPAEAPLEYLERALGTLDASGPSVTRLTDLFEWAKFSHHEPEPRMRDEAVDALIAVRDELREPVPSAGVEVPA